MHEQVASALLGVGDAKPHAVAGEHPGVADLTAGLRVKRRLVENNRAAVAGLQALDLLAVFHQHGPDAFSRFGLVAEKFGGAELFTQAEPDSLGRGVAGARPCGAGLRTLLIPARAE